jgi:AcrR family transcriptional regulator
MRAVNAAVELAHEMGIGQITVSHICQRGQIGRNTFYDLFGGSGACLRFGFEQGFQLVFAGAIETSREGGPWPQRLIAGLDRFYDAVAEKPLMAEFCLVHCFGAAERAEGHDFEAGVAAVARLLGGAREEARERRGPDYAEAPPLTEEYLARTMVSLAAQFIIRGWAAELPAQRWEMVMLALSAFFGSKEAGRARAELEAERSVLG